MEIESPYFNVYLSTQVREIPKSALQELIDEFAVNAKFYMASDLDSDSTAKITSAVIDMLTGRFKFLPLNLVAEAFTRGSLGELGGTTRFMVRNIYIWLTSIEDKNQRLFQENQSKIDDKRKAEDENNFLFQRRYSEKYGAAMLRKIEWCHAGLVNDKEYDRLSLDKIVEAMNKGYELKELIPEMI
jgi:hypothetical protein